MHHYYKCVSVKKHRAECRKKPVKKEWIEDLVVTRTMELIMDDKAIDAIVNLLIQMQEQENINLPLYEKQLRETNRAIDNMLNAIQQGILTRSTKERLDQLEATRDDLELKIEKEKLEKPRISPEFMTFWLHRFRKLDIRQQAHRKMLIDTFVNAIFLYDDKLVLTFNFKDGTQTITFDELKGAGLTETGKGSDMDGFGAHRSPLITKGLRCVWAARYPPPYPHRPGRPYPSLSISRCLRRLLSGRRVPVPCAQRPTFRCAVPARKAFIPQALCRAAG